jgi:PAS domain S-box-containing protein
LINRTMSEELEQALRESDKKYQNIFDTSPLGIFRSTFSGQFLVANRMFARSLGFNTPEELFQTVTNIADIYVDPRDWEKLKSFLLKQGVLIDYEIHLKDRIRKNCWVSVYARPVYDETGEAQYIDGFSIDITKRKWAELALIERSKELEDKSHEIDEINTALKVLLKNKDQDQKDFGDKIVANVKKLVWPYVEKLNNSRLNHQQRVYLNIIRSNLEDIISPYLHHLSSKSSDLTPREIQIAGLVKDGRTTKEIANLLNCSTGTIDFHRNNLRKKLGLQNTKTNLRAYLLTLT